MLITDFSQDIQQKIYEQDFDSVNKRLLEELTKILMDRKSDFVAMLQESGVSANVSMSNSELIEVFLANTHNKQMLLGASLLINYYNKPISFDGDDEISDENVKVGYAVMNQSFNGVYDGDDEDYSYIAPFIAGLATKKLLKEGSKAVQSLKGDGSGRANARAIMQQTAIEKQKLLLEQQKMEQERQRQKTKTRNAYLIAGGLVLVTLVGVFIYVRTRNK
jgi:hypothetical protein